MPAVSEGRAPESMRRGTLTRRGPPDSRPRMSLRGFFVVLLLSTLLAAPSAAAEWTPRAYAGASTIELRTVAAGEGEHWFPVWVVVIDDQSTSGSGPAPRDGSGHLKRLEKSRRPLVLTLNGKAKAVVIDAQSY